MDTIIVSLLGLLTGLLAGIAVASFYLQSRIKELQVSVQRVQQEASLRQLEEATRRAAAEQKALALPGLELQLASAQSRVAEFSGRCATLEAELVHERGAEGRLRAIFDTLSSEALQRNQQLFLEMARTTMEQQREAAQLELSAALSPIGTSLEKVERQIQEIERNREGAYQGLREHVVAMAQSQQDLRMETGRLVAALRSPVQRGRWGEIQLRRVVEMAGMVEHCDFFQQATLFQDDARQRPDLLVNLPGGKTVLVDAKVSLKAYLESLETQDEALRIGKLREHASQVRAHLVRLADKQYWSALASAPDFVVAFLPGEPFFSAALEQDPSLLEFGVERNVILATPTTLIALLKSVAYGWRQEKLEKNAQQISALGKQLYDRLATMHEHFLRLRQSLESAVGHYNKAVSSLETRVMVGARRFKEFGVSADKEIEPLAPIDTAPRLLDASDWSPGEVDEG